MSPNTLVDYNLWLVGLSFAVGAIGAFAGVAIARYVSDVDSEVNWGWLLLAALVLSTCAVWGTHFAGMLAYQPGVPVSYDIMLTGLSLVASRPMTIAGLYLVARWRGCFGASFAAGVLMGLGIAAMHYTTMAALRIPAEMAFNPILLGASIGVAIVVATLALRWAIRGVAPVRYGSAILLGGAIGAMHYLGMAAMEVQPIAADVEYSDGALMRETMDFGAAVAVGVGLLVALVSVLGREMANVIAERDHTMGRS